MLALHRQAGKLMKRSADKADVSSILQEFHVADQLLDSYMDAVRSFQNAWNQILAFQLGTAQQLEALYRPIHEAESRFNADTEQRLLDKATNLKASYAELEQDLQQETNFIQTKLLNPAMDAKQAVAPLRKLIKKRENYKLDFERHQSRHDHAVKKGIKSTKDDAAMVKFEADLSSATVLYENADAQVLESFPPIIDAIQVLIPLLMTEQIMLQHTLVGQLYTVMSGYCQNFGFAPHAPPLDRVVAEWDQDFTPLRHELETGLKMIAGGKAIHQPLETAEEKPSMLSGRGFRSKLAGGRSPSQTSVLSIRRTSSSAIEGVEGDQEMTPQKPPRAGGQGLITSKPRVASSPMSLQRMQSSQPYPEDEEAPPPRPPRPSSGPGAVIPSGNRTPSALSLSRQQSLGTPLPGMSPAATPGFDSGISSRKSSTSTAYGTPMESNGRPALSPLQNDYFAPKQQRQMSTSSMASSIAGKKKPPPPPVKRRPTNQELVVTALFDFQGQNDGDLAFREGDEIVVIKRTESTDDWWLGQVRGTTVTGSFPANYVQLP